MAITAFSDTSLTRARVALRLNSCDVLIAKGNMDGVSMPTTTSWPTFLADFSNIGVNSVDSPTWNFEPITEEYDYETETIQFNITGEIMVKKSNPDFYDFVETELINQETTVLIAPKTATEDSGSGVAVGDQILFISGVKLQPKNDGKANSAESTTMTFSFAVRRKLPSDVFIPHVLAAA